MDITLSTSMKLVMQKKELFPKLKQMGYTGVDVSFFNYSHRAFILSDCYEDEIISHCRNILDNELQISQVHLAYWPGHLPLPSDGSFRAFEEYMFPIWEKELSIASDLGCHVAVIHLYFEDDKKKTQQGNVELIRKLLPLCKKKQIVLAIENIYKSYEDAHFTTADDLLYYTEYFQNENLGICLDTGHAVILGQDPVALVQKLGSRIKTIHAHTTIPGRDLHAVPYSLSAEERIDWKAFYQTLCEKHYTGNFNMELSIPNVADDSEIEAFLAKAIQVAKMITS